MSFTMELPERVEYALDALEAAGFSAYVVGGAVRDCVMGRVAHDYDITTSAMPEEIKRVFASSRLVQNGEKHGTVGVIVDGDLLEITTFRIDGEYSDGRRPDSVSFTSLVEEDLGRRDFTVNAMAYSKKRGLCDPYGGRIDIENKTIRAVGVAKRRFEEDALRILRGFRFAARLGFDIDGETLAAMESERERLSSVSSERIYSELTALLSTKAPAATLALMHKTGVLGVVLGGESTGTLPAEGFAPIDLIPTDCGELSLFDSDGRTRDGFPLEGYMLRLSLLLRESDRDISEVFGGIPFSQARRRIALSAKREMPRSADVVEVKKFAVSERGGSALPLATAALTVCAARGATLESGESAADALCVLREASRRGDALDISELAVGGGELMAAGIAEGRRLGELIESLFLYVLEHPEHNDTRHLLALAKEIATG